MKAWDFTPSSNKAAIMVTGVQMRSIFNLFWLQLLLSSWMVASIIARQRLMLY
jgi:hypothetical protein